MPHPTIERMRHGIIVSCQPVPDGPTDSVPFVVGFALAARDGGAKGLRIEGAANVAAVCAACDLPVIALLKRDFDDYPVRITALLEDVAALADAGAPIIAVDATRRQRPVPVVDLIAAIHARGRLAMADCADIGDAVAAQAAGADIIGTTMSGYTGGKVPRGPDLAFVRAAAALGLPVFAEGRFNTPDLAGEAARAGAFAVVAGSAITRPENITTWYANAIAAVADARPVLALDIGGTKSSSALVVRGRIGQRIVLPTPRSAGPAVWLAELAAATRGWGFTGVAAAVSGVVRDGAWSAVNPATLPVPEGFPLEAELRERFGVAASAVNDAQAAAWGEYRFGAGAGRDMAFVTVSSGVGGGLVLGGRLLRGRHGLGGHIGQIPFPGARLEDDASGFGIARNAGAADAAAALAQGGAAVEAGIAALARGLVTLQAIADPEVIVVGGGFGLAEGVLERLRAAVQDHPAALRPNLVPAALGADAGLIGVADLHGMAA